MYTNPALDRPTEERIQKQASKTLSNEAIQLNVSSSLNADALQTFFSDKPTPLQKGGLANIYCFKDFFAIKCSRRQQKNDLIKREATAYKNLHLQTNPHPNIVKYFGTYEICIANQKWDLLALEYVPGKDLCDYIINYYNQNHCTLPQPMINKVMWQTANALDYIHHFNIVHLDIKPENILLDKENNIKLVDFGFAKKIPKSERFIKLTYREGTPDYVPPEVILKNIAYLKSDIYSLGVVFYILLTNELPLPPFTKKKDGSFYPDQVKFDKRFNLDLVTNNHLRFFKQLIERNPENRPKSKEVMLYFNRP